MSKSRSKKDKKKRRLLKKIQNAQQRKAEQEEKIQRVYQVSHLKLKIIIGLGILIAGIYFGGNYFLTRMYKGPDSQIQSAVGEVIASQKDDVAKRYPKGYKIISFDHQGMTKTYTDSLPKELEINWKEIRFGAADPEVKRENPLATKIVIPDIKFPPLYKEKFTLCRINLGTWR